MIAKKFLKKIKTSAGKEIILRFPRKDDVYELMEFINKLVDEDTFISNVKKVTKKEEEKYVSERLKKISHNEGLCVVAEHEGKIVANSTIDRVGGRSEHVGLFGIAVAKGFRNEGLGSILMEEILKLAKEKLKLKIVYMSMFSTNKRAEYVYEKFGFRECGRIPKGVLYKGEYVDHVYMCLEF